jgi:TonB-dependent receptor
MDGDAIGGTVNLVTKEPTGDRRFQVSAAVSDIVHAGQGTVRGAMTVGGRMADGKLHYLLTGSGSYRNFSSEGFQAEYDGGELDELQFSYSEINRQLYGVGAAIDYRMSDTSALFLNGLFSSFRDEEVGWHKREQVGEDRILRDLSDRLSQREIMSISGGGHHFFRGGGELDYELTFSESSETRPGDLLSSFQLKNVEFDPNVTRESIDPDNIRANPLNEVLFNFTLDGIERDDHETRDRDVVASVNLRSPLVHKPGVSGFARFGVKYRRKDAFRQQPHAFYQSGDELAMTDYLPGFEGSPLPGIIDERYQLGPFPTVGAMRGLWPTLEGEPLRETAAGDYEAAEDVAAGYAMADVHLGAKLRLLGGVRYERTSSDYKGYEVTFDQEGDHVETVTLDDSSDYGQLLPMLHLKLTPTDRTNLRLALTRTLARPSYYDLVPYSLVLRHREQIERGNPDLLPTTSWNFDALGEHFFDSAGLVSGGVFYKKLQGFIYPFTAFDEIDGGRWEITEPRNGEAATLLGVELAAQGQLRFLPEPFDALGLMTNLTLTDSEAQLPHRQGESSPLPGQSRHVGNLVVFYDKGGFSGRLSANFHGTYLDEVGTDATGDIYHDGRVQLDFSASQGVGDRARVFLELRNLTNTPVRRYIGEEDRPIQEEYYDWWAFFGVTLNFGGY